MTCSTQILEEKSRNFEDEPSTPRPQNLCFSLDGHRSLEFSTWLPSRTTKTGERRQALA